MKKVINIIGIVFLVGFIVIKILGAFLSKIPSVPNDYITKVKTGGDIEKKYLANGKYEVDYFESGSMSSLKKFEVYYPKDIEKMDKLPVVVFVNGTGILGSKYSALQKHLASWGFITIATEEENAFFGFSAEMSIRYLEYIENNSDDKNEFKFKGHIDLERIGITGHSQGGIGVINAVTTQKHSDMYKAAVILSSTETDMAKAFLWDSDSTLIKANTLMISGTGDTDSKISPLESLEKTYNNINGASKVLARRNDADHGEMLYYADGYVTAWFMYYLQNDKDANAFFGENPEMKNNVLYQDFQSNE